MEWKLTGRNKEIRVTAEEILYYGFLLLTMGAKGIGLTGGQKVFTLCLVIAYACLGLKLLLTEFAVKEWLVTGGLLLMAALIWNNSGETAALAAVCMVIGMKNIPVRRVIKVTLAIWGSTFVFSLLRGLVGLGDGVVVVHEKLGLGPVIRYSLGYTHPNVLHVTYFVLVLMILYLVSVTGKKLWALTGVLFLGNLYIFLYSISYTGMVIVTFALCLNLYLDMRKSLCCVEKILLQAVAPFCIIFPIAGPLVFEEYWHSAFVFFNRLLSTRFELIYVFFSTFDVSLFGTPTVVETEAHLTIDSSFAYLLMYYGIVAFLLLVSVYILKICKNVRQNKNKENMVLLSIALAGVTEQFLFNLSFKNISLFFIGDYVYNDLLCRSGETIWSRRIRIIPVPERTIEMAGIVDAVADFTEKKKKIQWKPCVLGALAAAVIGGVLFVSLWDRPEQVYVNRRIADRLENWFVVEEDQEWAEGNSLFIGNMEPEQMVYELRGNIIAVEAVRGMISSIIWSFAFGGLITFGFLYRKQNTKERELG